VRSRPSSHDLETRVESEGLSATDEGVHKDSGMVSTVDGLRNVIHHCFLGWDELHIKKGSSTRLIGRIVACLLP
jgi:hypothetical protein